MNKIFVCILVLAMCSFGGKIDVKSVTASATLPDQGKNSYNTKNLTDEKLETVWAASFEGKPIVLEIGVEAFEINTLRFLNGYRRDKNSYVNNSRAKKINIYANTKDNLVKSLTLTDFKWEYCMGLDQPKECPSFLKSIGLKKQEVECQEICSPLEYSENIFFKPAIRNVKKLIVEIESIYPGKKWADLCVTELSVDGNEKNPVSSGYKPEFGELVDSRDGHVYKTIKIDGKKWLADNLSFDTKGSSCYENVAGKKGSKDKICNKKGRVYKESAVSDNLCPQGWRLPTGEEYSKLNDVISSHLTLSEDEFIRYEELFDEDLSSNGFGLGIYNLDNICTCYDAGCDGDGPYMDTQMDILQHFRKKDGSNPAYSAFWIQPYMDPEMETKIPFVVVNTFNGIQTPYGELMMCYNDRREKKRREFFVRCIEK